MSYAEEDYVDDDDVYDDSDEGLDDEESALEGGFKKGEEDARFKKKHKAQKEEVGAEE